MITDPPYGRRVQVNVRSGQKAGSAWREDARSRVCRVVDVGFAPLSRATRRIVALEAARLVSRWSLVFSDPESAWRWRRSLVDAGLSYARTGAWVRLNPAPQFSGDRPAAGHDEVVICHRKPGRKHWNGGGHAGVWSHAVVINRGKLVRSHATEKPLSLMLELVELFTDRGDIILDPFAGVATLGVAALTLARRYVGIEKDAKVAAIGRARLADAACVTTREAREARQEPLFGDP
jgi:site-specific DNA-methyltransferase (adenine-specific)